MMAQPYTTYMVTWVTASGHVPHPNLQILQIVLQPDLQFQNFLQPDLRIWITMMTIWIRKICTTFSTITTTTFWPVTSTAVIQIVSQHIFNFAVKKCHSGV